MLLKDEIETMLRSNGVSDVGFAHVPDSPAGLDCAISIVIALSDAIIDEIDGAPTHTYFHHYRTVNAFIDNMLLQTGFMLQNAGYRFIPIAASQTIHSGGAREHYGRYSHKKAAVLAGLGSVGKSALFLHRTFGPRVRLGTLFTNCPIPSSNTDISFTCGSCRLCADACPAQAIRGTEWYPGVDREDLVDAKACNDYMRTHFMGIGRGAVCGICVKACPVKK